MIAPPNGKARAPKHPSLTETKTKPLYANSPEKQSNDPNDELSVLAVADSLQPEPGELAAPDPAQYAIPSGAHPESDPSAILFANTDHMDQISRPVIASLMEYGRHPSITITPAEMPTPETRTITTEILQSLDAGITGQSEIIMDMIGRMDAAAFESIKSVIFELHGFCAMAPHPSACIAAVASLKSHAAARRRWELASAIMTKGERGENVAALVAEISEIATTTSRPSLEAVIEARIFDHEHPPEKPVAIFTIGGHPIMTRGNIMNIQAPAKAGKSAAITGMIASAITMNDATDTLGFTSTSTSGALIHIDTEQSEYDHDALVRRAMRRADLDAPPPWLLSYCLTDLTPSDRRHAIHIIAANAARDHGAIRCIIIDGVGDLVLDPNDSEESFSMIDELVHLAMRYQTGIVTVLHENPGSETGKTRGHLGSQLERKSETNLRMAKDAAGVTTVWADRARHCHLPREQGTCFEWSDAAGMHVSCGTAREIKAQTKRNEMEEEVALAIGAVTSPMTYGELVGRIQEHLACSERTAKTRIKEWKINGLLNQLPTNKYERNT